MRQKIYTLKDFDFKPHGVVKGGVQGLLTLHITKNPHYIYLSGKKWEHLPMDNIHNIHYIYKC